MQAGYRPRVGCSDVPRDPDDQWLTADGAERCVTQVPADRDGTAAGLGEVPLLSFRELGRHLARLEDCVDHLGRVRDTDEGRLVYWMAAGVVAHEALHERWSRAAAWPLGWWPWQDGPDHPTSPTTRSHGELADADG